MRKIRASGLTSRREAGRSFQGYEPHLGPIMYIVGHDLPGFLFECLVRGSTHSCRVCTLCNSSDRIQFLDDFGIYFLVRQKLHQDAEISLIH